MAFALGYNDVTVKRTGVSLIVPNNSKARLMYYLDCMCTPLDLSSNSENLQRLRNYQNYSSLTASETNELLLLCTLLYPLTLNNKCIFHSEEASGNRGNEFFEVNSERTTFAAVQSVMIGSVRSNVTSVMSYSMSWLRYYYTEPMEDILR